MDDKKIKNLQKINNKKKANDFIEFAALPLRDVVVFPSMVIPLFVGRDKSIVALNHAMKSSKEIILIAQKLSNRFNSLLKYFCTLQNNLLNQLIINYLELTSSLDVRKLYIGWTF